MDKKLLIILLLTVLYIFLIHPFASQSEFKRIELKNIQKSIAEEKFIAKKANKIKTAYVSDQSVIKKNRSLFFPKNTPTSNDMSKLQQIIKQIAEKNGVQIVSINWGIVTKKADYYQLPISFRIRCYPNQMKQFIKELLSSDKLIRFKSFSISKFRKQILISAVVTGFKL